MTPGFYEVLSEYCLPKKMIESMIWNINNKWNPKFKTNELGKKKDVKKTPKDHKISEMAFSDGFNLDLINKAVKIKYIYFFLVLSSITLETA